MPSSSKNKIIEKWRGIRLAPRYAEALETLLRQELQLQRTTNEHARTLARRKIQRLRTQQQKLLDAYYDEALPVELLKSEQARLSRELRQTEDQLTAAQATDGEIEDLLGRCLEFAQCCDQVYAAASPKLRRQMNQALFEKFLIEDEGQVTGQLTGPFKVLLNPHLLAEEETTVEPAIEASTTPGIMYHRSSDWTRGMPAWAATHDSRRLSRLHLCQGSKENHLAELVHRLSNPSPQWLELTVALGIVSDSHKPDKKVSRP